MADVLGQRQVGNVEQAQRVIDMHKEILLLEPDAAPLTVITRRIYDGGRRKPALDSKFSWMEDELEARFGTVNGAHDGTTTTISVVDGSIFPVETLVKVPATGEVMLVTAVNGNNLTVVRGVGATSGAALADQEPLYIMAVADEEGDVSQQARTNNPVPKTNYTQIFKTSVETSGTWLSSANITTEHDWNYQHRKKGIEHLKSIELAFLFGSPSENAAGVSGARRTTGGVLHFATENISNINGTLSEAEWETFVRTVTRYGGRKKVAFASPLVISALNEFSSKKLQTSVGDETYGVRVMNLISAHGEITLVKHNLLEGATYGGYLIAVDFAQGNVMYRFLNAGPGGSRDTKLRTNIQEPDRDGQKDEWLSECGLQFGSPKMHGVMTGVTGAE